MSQPPAVPPQGAGEPAPDLGAPTDLELVDAARAGDGDASAELFRRHASSAHRFARQLTGNDTDADDLVSEAFARVLASLRDGKGPTLAFRPYLLTTVRRLHVSGLTAARREQPVAELDPYAIPEQATDRPLAEFENNAAVMAFASLPERWQVVLWQTEVEGQKPAAVAAGLGMSAGAVSALALRAREGLRQAWLQAHLADADVSPACREARQNLGSYVRGGLGPRMKSKVHAHLADCGSCTALYLELMAENSWLPAVIAPALLGVFAGSYIAKAGLVAGGTAAAGGGLHGILSHAGSSLSRLARSAGTTGAAVAGVVVLAVAAAAAGLWATGSFGADRNPVLSGPSVTTPAPKAVHRAAPQVQKRARTKPSVSPKPSRSKPSPSKPSPSRPSPSKAHSVRPRGGVPVVTASPSPSPRPSRVVPLPPTSPRPTASSPPTASPTPRRTPATAPASPTPKRTARTPATATPRPSPPTSTTPSPEPTATPTPSRTPSPTPAPTVTPTSTPTPPQPPVTVSVSAIGQPNAAAIIQVGVDRPAVLDLTFGPASIAVLTLSSNCTPGPATSFTCHYADTPGISQFLAAGLHDGQGVLVTASTDGTTTKYQCKDFELGHVVSCSRHGANG